MNIKIVGRTIGRVILMEMLFMLPSLDLVPDRPRL